MPTAGFKKASAQFKKELGTIKKGFGIIQKCLGAIQKDFGAFQKQVGAFQKSDGAIQKGVGTFQKGVGREFYAVGFVYLSVAVKEFTPKLKRKAFETFRLLHFVIKNRPKLPVFPFGERRNMRQMMPAVPIVKTEKFVQRPFARFGMI